ncbi:hypothetical protein N7532_009536 [Penicillium argentinense]|uniref:Uncharacterized protein n=1 Tax=Penicillium argentinense TaxID=1131581 RepID=A0A9W9EZM4_9EURO|nr:uncharacterized protein N7532_009536 [Penicillium argentinense]KAJ5090852.1 hypothetical protein N7532_009536 [Penicillium argentinense]
MISQRTCTLHTQWHLAASEDPVAAMDHISGARQSLKSLLAETDDLEKFSVEDGWMDPRYRSRAGNPLTYHVRLKKSAGTAEQPRPDGAAGHNQLEEMKRNVDSLGQLRRRAILQKQLETGPDRAIFPCLDV